MREGVAERVVLPAAVATSASAAASAAVGRSAQVVTSPSEIPKADKETLQILEDVLFRHCVGNYGILPQVYGSKIAVHLYWQVFVVAIPPACTQYFLCATPWKF